MLSRVRNMKRATFALVLVILGLLALIPFIFGGDRFWLNVFIFANIWAILAMSWDIVSGYTGQISFGHSFFFGIGGYTAALIGKEFGLLPYFTIPLAGVAAAVGGLIIAGPALRLKGPYFSLITLVAAIGMDQLVRYLQIGSTGAEGAILCDLDPTTYQLKCIPGISTNYIETYYISLALMLAVAIVLLFIARSRIGLAFESIRDDEEAAEAAGINTAKFKALAFVISGFVGGLAGAFLVHHQQIASPGLVFKLDIAIEAIVASVLGGMGTIIGPIGGAYFLVIIREWLRPFGPLRYLLLFVLALLISFIIPKGILTEVRLRILEWIKTSRQKLFNQGKKHESSS